MFGLLSSLTLACAHSDFIGKEKIVTPDLPESLKGQNKTVMIIVRLRLPSDTPAGGKEVNPDELIRRVKKDVLSTLPEGSFQLIASLDNLPVMVGSCNLEGLIALAGHPLVETIEKDQPLRLNNSQKKDSQ